MTHPGLEDLATCPTSRSTGSWFLVRLGSEGERYWFVICAVIGLALLIVMRGLVERGDDAGALLAMAAYALLASPVSWSHHWVWVVPALVTLAAWALESKKMVAVGSSRSRLGGLLPGDYLADATRRRPGDEMDVVPAHPR